MAAEDAGARVPGLAQDGAALSAAELRAVEELAARMAATDPAWSDRLSRLGGYETSPLGLPSRWSALPVALVGILLAVAVLAVALTMDATTAAHIGRT